MRSVALKNLLVLVSFLYVPLPGLFGAEVKSFGPDRRMHAATVERAIQFLATNQSQDGSLSSHIGIGPTALAVCWSLLLR